MTSYRELTPKIGVAKLTKFVLTKELFSKMMAVNARASLASRLASWRAPVPYHRD